MTREPLRQRTERSVSGHERADGPKREGLSRTEYLPRTLESERAGDAGPVTIDHLERVASVAADLDDPT